MAYKKLHKHLSIFAVLAWWAAFASGLQAQPISGNFTINKSLSASSTNFVSFQSFFNKLSSQGVNGAVTVTVQNGPYTEQVFVQAIPGASSANPITINGGNEILRYSLATSADRHTLRFDGASYITVRNLVVEALGTTHAWGIQFINGADNITLENCTIRVPNCTSNNLADGNGIVASGSNTNPRLGGAATKNLAIRGCTITGGVSAGPWAAISLFPQSNGNTIAGISITHCVIQNFKSIGIFITQGRGIKVSGNFFSRPTLVSAQETFAIKLVNGNQEDTIIANRIFDCYKAVPSGSNFSSFYGIHLENSTGNIVVANNTIYENNHNGAWYGIYMSCSPTTKIIHNTISADNKSLNSASGIIGFIHDNSTCSVSTGSEFRNNIVSISQAGSGTRYAVYQKGGAILYNNNNLYVAGSSAYTGWAGKNYATLTDWQNATGAGTPFDANSEAVEPKYLNPASGNLSPGAVELDNLGYAAGILGDISNAQRNNSTPDPGAFEFSIDANVSRIVKPAANACEGESDSVSVWIVNNSGLPISDFTVEYKVNNGVVEDEIYTGSILPGDSGLFTFSKPVHFVSPGNYSISAKLRGKNYIGPSTTLVSAIPTGFSVSKRPGFTGFYNTGDTLHPDIVAPNDTVAYQLNVGGIHTNANYGLIWGLPTIQIEEAQGKNKIALADTSSHLPDSGLSAYIRFIPNTAQIGDTVLLKIKPKSLLTGCSAASLLRTIVVVAKPDALFMHTNVCEGAPIPFTNASTITGGAMTYKWYFGDNDSSTLTNPSKTYRTPGNYKVTLVAKSNNGYIDSFTNTITVYDAPDVNFTYTNRCQGIAINFTDATKISNGVGTYDWNFGDNFGVSASTNPTYQYAQPNIYWVRLKVTDTKGCSSFETKPVTFSKKPIASFSLPALNCNQKNVAFTNNSQPFGPTGYTWDFGDGTIASSLHVEHTFDSAGSFAVKLIAINQFGCTDTATKMVTLLKSPATSFVVSSQCAMQPMRFVNTTDEPAGGVNYTWNFGDGDSSALVSPTHIYSSIGSYTIALQATANNGCVSKLQKTLFFYEQPVSYFSMPAIACIGNYVNIANGSKISAGNLSYLWDFGNGDTGSLETPMYTFPAPGIYNVTLTAFSGGGCGQSFTRQIQVYEKPESGFTVNSRKTADGFLVLTPKQENGAGFYKWIYGDGQTGSLKTTHHYQYLTPGIYTISLQVVNDACASATTQTISINPLDVGVPYLSKQIKVYPNPTAGNIKLAVGEGLLVNNVHLYTLEGKLLFADFIPTVDGDNGYTYNFENLSGGMYLLKIQTNEGILFEKITLSRP